MITDILSPITWPNKLDCVVVNGKKPEQQMMSPLISSIGTTCKNLRHFPQELSFKQLATPLYLTHLSIP